MRIELLFILADIINSCSKRYYALIPKHQYEYLMYEDNGIKHSSCHVLRIMRTDVKRRSGMKNFCLIYEKDLDHVIKGVCRRDKEFAKRIDLWQPTPHDVEMLVRRASFRLVHLNLSQNRPRENITE